MTILRMFSAAVFLIPAGAISAQGTQSVDFAQGVSSPSGQAAQAPLDKQISLTLESASVKEALREVSRVSGVAVTYGSDAAEYDGRVTVRANQETVENTLKQILRGTGLSFRLTSTGQVVVTRPFVPAAAKEGVIVGKVINAKTKQPIAGATLVLDNAPLPRTTGADGTFRIPVNVGKYSLQVRAVGFVRTTQQVTVSEGTVTLEVAMDPSASVLDEIVVTGTVVATARKEIPTPITVITAEEIEKRGITRIEQFFRGEVPGVLALEQGSEIYADGLPETATNFGAAVSSKVFTRGASGFARSSGDDRGSPTPLKTYVDGVEILNPSYLGTIDPQSIERIEIITGPQAATIYGSGAMGGVMQIFTKRGNQNSVPELTLSLRQGFLQNNISDGLTPKHNHALSMTGGSGPEFSYAANLSYNYTGQWRPGLWIRSIGASVGVTHTRDRVTASGSYSLTTGKNGSSGGGGPSPSPVFLNNLATGEYTLGFSSFNSAHYMIRMVGSSSAQTASLNLSYRQSDRLQHHLTVGRNQSTFGQQADRPRFALPSDTVWTTGSSSGQRTTASYNLTAQVNPGGWVSSVITAGVNGSTGTQTNVSGCTATAASTTYLDRCNSYRGTQVNRAANDESWGEFASWRIGLFQQLYFTLGLRAEQNPAYGKKVKVDWTPTNGLAYTLERGEMTVKLLGSYGSATRAPTPEMRLFREQTNPATFPSTYVSQLEAPNLTAEYSRGPQGGIEFYYGSRGSFSVNRYRQLVTDLIQNVTADSIQLLNISNGTEYWMSQTQYQNAGKIRQHGWEFTSALNLFRFNIRSTYSWNDSRVIAVNTTDWTVGNFYPGKSLQQVPTHMGNLSISYAYGGTSISLVNNYIGQSLQEGTDGIISLAWDYSRIKTYIPRGKGRVFVELAKPGYVKSDLSIMHRITPWASATLNMLNLGNSVATDVAFYSPSLGRQTTFGVTLRSSRTR